MNAGDPLEWYMEIPVVSRTYLTLSFITTAACALDLVSPFSLYFNYKLIVQKAQLWRLLSNFLFFGTFGIDFVFHMYFLCRYSRLLEENSFRGRTADFVWMLFLGALVMLGIAPFVSVHFLGSSLTFMMVYVWGRRNRYERMSFLGLFPFTAPYLPWVLLSFSVLLGHTWLIDAIGMVVGHLYFYLEDVYPAIADARGWKRRKLLATPSIVHWICGTAAPVRQNIAVVAEPLVLDPRAGVPAGAGFGDDPGAAAAPAQGGAAAGGAAEAEGAMGDAPQAAGRGVAEVADAPVGMREE